MKRSYIGNFNLQLIICKPKLWICIVVKSIGIKYIKKYEEINIKIK